MMYLCYKEMFANAAKFNHEWIQIISFSKAKRINK